LLAAPSTQTRTGCFAHPVLIGERRSQDGPRPTIFRMGKMIGRSCPGSRSHEPVKFIVEQRSGDWCLMSISISESMTTATVRDHLHSTWLPTAVCCVGVVGTGLSFENSVFSFSIIAALCIGLLSYGTSTCGSRIKAAKLLLFNSGLLALIFTLLRVALVKIAWHFPPVFWPRLPRIFRVLWLSECSAILLALIAAGLVATEVAGNIGGDTTRRRFQWCVIAAASILVVVNIASFLRPVWCADCFFPYGLPFTLFTEGGFAGGGGVVWLGLVADAALIPALATICTLLWSRIAA
jgi:hypothetical protein